MPTYNFTTGGDIYIDSNFFRAIDGPAALTPRTDAGYFTLKYLDGSDLFYYPTNVFEIDGEVFEGTLEEFCDAAEAVFPSTGGGGESYPDISTSTVIEIDATKAFSINDSNGNGMIYAYNESATTQHTGLGDVANAIEVGGSGAVYQDRSATAAGTSIGAWFDNYTTYAGVSTTASDSASARMEITTPTRPNMVFELNDNGFVFSGGIEEYADNAAAITAGLPVTTLYHTGGILKIVI